LSVSTLSNADDTWENTLISLFIKKFNSFRVPRGVIQSGVGAVLFHFCNFLNLKNDSNQSIPVNQKKIVVYVCVLRLFRILDVFITELDNIEMTTIQHHFKSLALRLTSQYVITFHFGLSTFFKILHYDFIMMSSRTADEQILIENL
jgi:hypothetical protein